MRFAIIGNEQVEAEPGLKGLCPGCFQPVIAKCGTQRISHWAHLKIKTCDSWWETETEWHRSWKNNFPRKWQEVFLPDTRTGEKHIADVRTDDGLVIEFQHSHIDPQERKTRESFYKDMVWVVDATRLKRDYPRFSKARKSFHCINKQMFHIWYPDECFPSSWLESSVPVIFDFLGTELATELKDDRNYLYCLFPIKIGSRATLAVITRRAFTNALLDGSWSFRVNKVMHDLTLENQERARRLALEKQVQAVLNHRRFMSWLVSRKRRRRL